MNKNCGRGKRWPTKQACLEANPGCRPKQCKCCHGWYPDSHKRKGDRG